MDSQSYEVLDLSLRQTIEKPNAVLDLSVPKDPHISFKKLTVRKWITDSYISPHDINCANISSCALMGNKRSYSPLVSAIDDSDAGSSDVIKGPEVISQQLQSDDVASSLSSISDLSSVSSILSLSQKKLSSFIPSLQNIVGAIGDTEPKDEQDQTIVKKKLRIAEDEAESCLDGSPLTKTPQSLYFCKYCRQWFYSSEALNEHKKIHMNSDKPKNFVCKYCKMAFKGAAELKIHERTHTGEKPYSCDICGFCFAQSGNLTQHRKLHLGFKPLACDICGKRFMRQYDMLRHRDTHTGYRPYKCEICNKTFVRAGHLTLHKRNHFDEKKFDCCECGEKFVQLSQLTEHKKSHLDKSSNYCQECNLSFSCSNEQHEHLNTFHVANFLPFACDFCDKRYKHSRALEKHRKTHQIPPVENITCLV